LLRILTPVSFFFVAFDETVATLLNKYNLVLPIGLDSIVAQAARFIFKD